MQQCQNNVMNVNTRHMSNCNMEGGGKEVTGLVTKDEIEVPTSQGLCKIQLSYGSVTKLSKEDEVDVLVISAFPNSYSETPWSVIGALRRELGISVSELADNKEEDLRQIFSCWWSKELPQDVSFRRILCFEGSYKTGARPPSVIGEVFRCLVSLSKKHAIKVMMPLVATGHQGYDYKMMLSLLVEAAIHWMEIGLLLHVLKIVIYQKDLKQVKDDPMLKAFTSLKQKWMKEQAGRTKATQNHPLHYDIYLSYCPNDRGIAEKVIKQLMKLNKKTVIYSERQEVNPEKTWQDHIYMVMLSCARVITLITPWFLTDKSCLEQYNIALCCTRNMKRDYLAPLYIETIQPMPTYMSLIQYIDCRPCTDDALTNACAVVANWLQSNLPKLKAITGQEVEAATHAPTLLGDHYDVFISYSHKNSDAAQEIKRHLAVFHPDWKIFIDVADLKTGVVWQTKLYNSIENSRIVLCLISPYYIASKVCQEEYNLAMNLICDPAYGTVLFPILVEPVEKLPTWCCDYPPLDTSEKNISAFLSEIELLKKLDGLRKPKQMSVSILTQQWREKFFAMDFPLLPNVSHALLDQFKSSKRLSHTAESPIHVVLCYHHNQKRLADFFAKRVASYVNQPVIERPRDSAEGKALIDKADIVVLFLSSDFLTTPVLVEDANVALCRQRWTDKMVLFPICVDSLPSTPAYFSLLLTLFSVTDGIWENKKLTLKERISWLSTLNSRHAVFLDTAALFASFIVCNSSCFKGSFKTLLSLQELAKSTKEMSDEGGTQHNLCNPLVFEECTPAMASQHSIEGGTEDNQESQIGRERSRNDSHS